MLLCALGFPTAVTHCPLVAEEGRCARACDSLPPPPLLLLADEERAAPLLCGAAMRRGGGVEVPPLMSLWCSAKLLSS